ncbi:hypothetical protein A2U01_0099118, partial [Trifolium medium]|nr:hypothetical protein [Trifolium medium]
IMAAAARTNAQIVARDNQPGRDVEMRLERFMKQ